MTPKPFLPALLWLVVITYLSVTSGVQMPKINLLSADKIGHAFAYALLVWLLAWGVKRAKNRPATGAELFGMFVLATAYGAFMEWIQGKFFPNRFFEYDDMLANAAGAFLSCMVLIVFKKLK